MSAPNPTPAPTEICKRRRVAERFRQLRKDCAMPVAFSDARGQTPADRKNVIEFMAAICADFDFKETTMALSASYYDLFMRCPFRPAYKDEMAGAICVLLAAKFGDLKFPSIAALLARLEGCFTRSEVVEAELGVLTALGWNLHATTPYTFLEQLKTVVDMCPGVKGRAGFFVAMSYLDHKILEFSPATVAVSALVCAQSQLLEKGKRKDVAVLCNVCDVCHSDVQLCTQILADYFEQTCGVAGE